MKKLGLATGAVVGIFLTAALLGLMYLGRQAADLPFAPFDQFNWMARELPGDLVTFGIDLMIDTMLFLHISVVDAAKTAEQIMAVTQFLAIGIFAGAAYFAIMKSRGTNTSPSPASPAASAPVSSAPPAGLESAPKTFWRTLVYRKAPVISSSVVEMVFMRPSTWN